jgi:DNA polymerase-3 subunit gamma/tau
MRAFEVLSKAEADIRASMQPRYHLEMALLRWIHLRKLVPLSSLIQGLDAQAPTAPRPTPAPASRPTLAEPRWSAPMSPRPAPSPAGNSATVRAVEARREQSKPIPPSLPDADRSANGATPADLPSAAITDPVALKTAFLAEVQKAKKFFYGTVIAQAHHIDVEADRIVIAFAPQHKAMRAQVDPLRTRLEEIASQLAGRRIAVVAVETAAPDQPSDAAKPSGTSSPDRQSQLREQALADKSVQALLDVFGTEIKEVEER